VGPVAQVMQLVAHSDSGVKAHDGMQGVQASLRTRQHVEGHGGGEDWRFTRAMAPCLRAWLDRPAAEAPRGLRRDGC
jgi:hypothetical protein